MSENMKKLIDSNPLNWEYSKDSKLIDGDRLFKLGEVDSEATMAGYQSPITMIVHDIETQIENDCVKAVQKYGFDIDAEELYKALKYDREQYKKGYADAKREYERPQGEWIPVSERLPEENGEYLVTREAYIDTENGNMIFVRDIACFTTNYGFNNGFHKANTVIAWQPLPELYQKGGAE